MKQETYNWQLPVNNSGNKLCYQWKFKSKLKEQLHPMFYRIFDIVKWLIVDKLAKYLASISLKLVVV